MGGVLHVLVIGVLLTPWGAVPKIKSEKSSGPRQDRELKIL